MLLAIDTKNLALFHGGIAAFFRPLLEAWVDRRPGLDFVLVGPPFDAGELAGRPNCTLHPVGWPSALPRPLRHPVYDNWLFPRALRTLRPDFVFTPYHDVRLPRGVPSAMMIHDTCLGELAGVYPRRVRWYYGHMLGLNLRRAGQVLTVSETSRHRVMAQYNLDPGDVTVVPNALSDAFTRAVDTAPPVRPAGGPRLLYTGGSDYRKNAGRLLAALAMLLVQHPAIELWISGPRDAGWERALAGVEPSVVAHLQFLDYLPAAQLRDRYLAADGVVYPSLCEGFGRVCLEAMALGIPLACSDLPVLREVAGDYPHYFNPLDVADMATAIAAAAGSGRRSPVRDPRFDAEAVKQRFVSTLDTILLRVNTPSGRWPTKPGP